MSTKAALVVASIILSALSGCAVDGMNKTATYGGLGALAGAVAGAAISHDNRGKGALIGAALAGTAAAGYGYYADKQEAELRRQLEGSGVGIQRQGDAIKLIMPGNVTFRTGSSDIARKFYSPLSQIASSLKQYDQSLVTVVGHTDNTGSSRVNMSISQLRALSVSNYLVAQGVADNRFTTAGAGPNQPIANNATDEGRQENRRVEISLQPRNGV